MHTDVLRSRKRGSGLLNKIMTISRMIKKHSGVCFINRQRKKIITILIMCLSFSNKLCVFLGTDD